MRSNIAALTSYAVNDKCVFIDVLSGLVFERCAVVISVDLDGDVNLMYTDVKGELYGDKEVGGNADAKFAFLGHVGDSITPKDLCDSILTVMDNYGMGIKDILILAEKCLKIDTSKAEDVVKIRVNAKDGEHYARIEAISDFYEFGDWSFDLTKEDFGASDDDGLSLEIGLIDAVRDYEAFLGKKISVEVDFEDGYDELRDKYLEKIRAFVGENLTKTDAGGI